MGKRVPIVDLTENVTVHCKGYIQPSLDKAIKAFQAQEIQATGLNITYSEAMRKLICVGLRETVGMVYKREERYV